MVHPLLFRRSRSSTAPLDTQNLGVDAPTETALHARLERADRRGPPGAETTTIQHSPNEFMPALESLQSALYGAASDRYSPALSTSAVNALASASSYIHAVASSRSSHTQLQKSTASLAVVTTSTTSNEPIPTVSNREESSSPKALPFIITAGAAAAVVLALVVFRVWRQSRRRKGPSFSPMFGGRTPPGFREKNISDPIESWQKFEDGQGTIPPSISAAHDFAHAKTIPAPAPAKALATKDISRPYSATPPSAPLAQANGNGLTKSHSVNKQEIGKPQLPQVGLGFDPKVTVTTMGHYSIQVPTKPAPTPRSARKAAPAAPSVDEKSELHALRTQVCYANTSFQQ